MITLTEEQLKEMIEAAHRAGQHNQGHCDPSAYEAMVYYEREVKKLIIPDVIFWQRFDQVKPQGDAEYLVCNTDGIIRVSYFDGINWGYLSTVKENITHWSILPQVPVI